jgi:hypothetical protein
MGKLSVGTIALLSLLVSVLVPATPALSSVPDVTKSFTITQSNGTAYPGVLVALIGYDENLDQIFLSPTSTTNSSGLATIQVPGDADYYGWAAQPPAGDVTHAIFEEYGVVFGENEAFTAKLSSANIAVNLLQSNGSPAAIGSSIGYISSQDSEYESYRTILRTGPFGLDLSTSLQTGAEYEIVIHPNGMSTQFGTKFGLKVNSSTDPISRTVFTDTTYATELTPVSSVYQLRFAGPNFSGQLRSSSGEPLTLASGVKAFAQVYKSKSDGTLDAQNSAAGSVMVEGNGSFNLRLYEKAQGKYFVKFAASGSHSIPSHVGNSFWINSQGQFSMTESGVFQDSSSFVYSSNTPSSPNLRVVATQPNGAAAEKTYISVNEIREDGEDGAWWGGWSSATDGLASFQLPDGAYRIHIDPQGSLLVRGQFDLNVDGGTALITSESGEVINAGSSGSYNLPLAETNFRVKVVNPTDATKSIRSANIDVFTTSGYGDDYVTSGYVQNGFAGLSIPNGTYLITVNPFVGAFAPKDYELTRSGSLITVTDPSTSPPTVIGRSANGEFVLTVNNPNVTGVVLDPGGTPFSPKNNKWARVEIQKKEGNNWQHHTSVQVKNDGSFGAYVVEPGTYRPSVRVNGDPSAVNTVFSQFDILSATSVVNLGNLTLKSPTFQIQVRQAGSTKNEQFAQVSLTDYDGEGQWFDTGSAALAGVAIEVAGTYELRIEPPYGLSSALAAAKTYTLIAEPKTGGGFDVSIADSLTPSTPIPDVNGVYSLYLAVPNVTGKIFDSAGQAFNGRDGDYAWIQAEKYDESSLSWNWTNFYANVFEDGSFGLSIDQNGKYRLKIDPYGLPNTSTTRTVEFDVTDANRNGTAKAFGNLTLSAPTAKFRVRAPGSSVDLKFTGIEVRKDGKWLDWLNVGNDGLARFTALGTGEYEFTAIPNDKSPDAVRKTYKGTVSGSESSYTLSIPGLSLDSSGAFVLELGTPNVTGKLTDSTGQVVSNTRNSWVWIQVQKYLPEEDRWEWVDNSTNVRFDGTFGLSVTDPGTYRLRIETSGRQDVALTYSASFTVTTNNASTFSRDFGEITLNSPTLSGTVLDPEGKSKSNAQVVAIDSVTGEEMWEQSTWTDNAGKWAMLLPAGNYSLLARPGWRDATNGASEELTGISVSSSGQVTFSDPSLSNPLTLSLGQPTWSGTVVSPIDNTTPIVDASVCLYTVVGQRGASSCSQTDGQGRWALSKPSGFTGFNSQSTLTITENGVKQFAEERLTGVSAIQGVLGVYEPGSTYPNKKLSPAAPNAVFTVMAGSNPATNAWVSVFRSGQWLGGANTDTDGKARLSIPDVALGFSIEAQPNSTPEFVSTRKSFNSAAVSTGTSPQGIFSATIELATPNFKGTVNEPGAEGLPVRNSWVELVNESTGEWLGGSGTNALGQFSLRLEPPSSGTRIFKITAHPSWSNNVRLLSKQTYFAELTSAGVLTLREGTKDGTVVSPTLSEYALELKTPSATGFVVLPDGATRVRDSWVVPIDVNQNRRQLWEMGQNSRGDGSFGLALADGIYQVFANVPGQLSNFARSALCDVTISGGQVTTPNSSCVVDKQIVLKLRDPNLTFQLMDGNSGVANAHVGVSVGNWYGWAQSSQDGTVSLLIDEAEIAESNPQWTTGTLPVNLDINAPYGNTSVVSWRCASGDQKPICKDISSVTKGQAYLSTAKNLGQVEFQKPNTTLIVRQSNGEVVENSWVALYRENANGWRQYIGSSSSDLDGKVVFNVENTSGTFSVELHAPWNLKSTQARKSYSNLAYGDLTASNADFKLAAPNLTLNVKQSQIVESERPPSRWANVWVEEVQLVVQTDPNDNYYNYVRWVDGYGADEDGSIQMFLEPSKTYRINVNPGPNSTGAQTSCVVSVASNGVVSQVAGYCPTGEEITNGAMNINLSLGNVYGKVRLGNETGPSAVGAIVFAEAFESNNSNNAIAGLTRESIVDANGDYGLQLDPAYTWKLKVFYVNPSPNGTQYSSLTTPFEILAVNIPSGNSRSESNFTLLAR